MESTDSTPGIVTYNIDPVSSSARFSIRHFGIAFSRGEFSEVDGTVTLDTSDLTKTAITAYIKTNSFSTNHEQRDAHVKSSDFLDVDQFPTITFESTSASIGLNSYPNVTGNLTLHGVTKSITLSVQEISDEVNDGYGHRRVGVTAITRIRMSDYGIKFDGKLENGARILADEVDITLDIQLIR